MAESDLHRDEMVYLIEAMQEYFADVPDVYVSGNLLLYYVEGDPRSSVSPDALVARGLDRAKERRRIYKLWEEGRMPCCVFEVTSPSTRKEDLRHKKALYADLGVEELFLYDPLEEYLHPPLQGFRLAGGEYQPIQRGPDGALFSETTGLLLKLEGTLIHLVDPRTGKRLLRRAELAAQVRDAESRAAAAEEELVRLRAQLAKETAG
ncbi:MAG TPA: Uma2 family endonuclease [Thermoanaerobaculia bacterium]|nr:Uma2 family endonuclease [Thermoanaerobaculia bacterium]